mmetsp:Transcript_3069/g.12668  ORF Transcript_3069/g.12668 Transcript_3069/m.12668 type:complete len:331 (+) Transcript_3069:784-1776(+)
MAPAPPPRAGPPMSAGGRAGRAAGPPAPRTPRPSPDSFRQPSSSPPRVAAPRACSCTGRPSPWRRLLLRPCTSSWRPRDRQSCGVSWTRACSAGEPCSWLGMWPARSGAFAAWWRRRRCPLSPIRRRCPRPPTRAASRTSTGRLATAARRPQLLRRRAPLGPRRDHPALPRREVARAAQRPARGRRALLARAGTRARAQARGRAALPPAAGSPACPRRPRARSRREPARPQASGLRTTFRQTTSATWRLCWLRLVRRWRLCGRPAAWGPKQRPRPGRNPAPGCGGAARGCPASCLGRRPARRRQRLLALPLALPRRGRRPTQRRRRLRPC